MNRAKLNSSFPATRSFRGLPKSVWTLGLVSLFMDSSSELVHSLLPVFMATTLGASMTTIGAIEGIAEAIGAITKVFSGVISDHVGRRKILVVLGYGLAAVTKPIFPLAGTIGWVSAARFIDRIGKGIRGAPRDALVADITPRELLGAAYGLRQSLDTVGAFVGPLLAVIFMAWLADELRAVLWVSVVPAFVAVLLLVLGVHEPERPEIAREVRSPLSLNNARLLPRRFWLIVGLGSIFTMARFSEAFLVLRARDVGLAVGFVPIVLIVMNVVYSITAYPVGIAADRLSRRTLLIVGLSTLVIADLILASATSISHVFIGVAFWGLHMGFTQGLFATLVADAAPVELRGAAFGIFNLVSGGALLLASVIAGSLWSKFGASAPFVAGASFAALAATALLLYHRKLPRSTPTAEV